MLKSKLSLALTGGGLFVVGVVLLTTAWFGFYFLNDHCLVQGYTNADGCVTVQVNWVSLAETWSYPASVGYRINEGDCWMRRPYDDVLKYLQKEFPVGKNHSCYRANSWFLAPIWSSNEDMIYFSNQPIMTDTQALMLVFIGIGLFLSGFVIVGLLIILAIQTCIRRKKYTTILAPTILPQPPTTLTQLNTTEMNVPSYWTK